LDTGSAVANHIDRAAVFTLIIFSTIIARLVEYCLGARLFVVTQYRADALARRAGGADAATT
jgi:hypothetical protein